jgi:homoserine kinase type II
MNTLARVRCGLALLGRIHALLRTFPSSASVSRPRFANYIAAAGLTDAVATGTRRIRAWQPTPAEGRLADLADELAGVLAGQEHAPLRPQLVHGDFWDDNVRFHNEQVALVADFDFLGERPRIDDLALTLYYTSVDIADITSDPGQLIELVDTYEAGLGARLSQDERAAVPLAMARQPLWSISVWVALLDSQATARRHLAATAAELDGALRFAGRIARSRRRSSGALDRGTHRACQDEPDGGGGQERRRSQQEDVRSRVLAQLQNDERSPSHHRPQRDARRRRRHDDRP